MNRAGRPGPAAPQRGGSAVVVVTAAIVVTAALCLAGCDRGKGTAAADAQNAVASPVASRAAAPAANAPMSADAARYRQLEQQSHITPYARN